MTTSFVVSCYNDSYIGGSVDDDNGYLNASYTQVV